MDFAGKNKSKSKSKRDSMKVVYISTPMKVKTSASRFRTLVQELTGRDSDIARFMDGNGAATTDFDIVPENFRAATKSPNGNNHHQNILSSSFPLVNQHHESPRSSDSLLEQSLSTDVFMNSQIEEQYLQGMFSSNLFSESSQLDLDVLGI